MEQDTPASCDLDTSLQSRADSGRSQDEMDALDDEAPLKTSVNKPSRSSMKSEPASMCTCVCLCGGVSKWCVCVCLCRGVSTWCTCVCLCGVCEHMVYMCVFMRGCEHMVCVCVRVCYRTMEHQI